MLQVSYSALQAWCKCHRSWYYRYVRNIAPIQVNTKMETGTIYHDTIRGYRCYPPADRSLEVLAFLLDEAIKKSNFDGRQERDQRPLLTAMIQAYWRVFGKDEEIPQLATGVSAEAGFRRQLLEGVEFCGKVDGLCQIDDDWWILEDKTGNPDQEFYALLDVQGSLYCWAFGAVGVRYTFVTQPTSRTVAVANRLVIERTEEEIDQALREACCIARELDNAPTYHRTRSWQCNYCDYKLICCGVMSGADEDETIADNYRKVVPEWLQL